MNVLVTGGAGFIGSHICDRLLEYGHRVCVVDNLSTGRRENVPAGAILYQIDLRDEALDQVFGIERPDVVFHQAAHANVTESVRDPKYDAWVNIGGSLNLLSCCVRHKVGRVIYASTGGALYGEPEYIPADENHPIRPLSPYGISKYAVEHYLRLHRELHGLAYVVLRYPNVYGPRQDPKGEAGVVAIFCSQLLAGQRPIIFGDGTKTRDYCYIGDIVEANILALNGPESGVYNLGRGIEVSDLEIFETVREAVGCTVAPKFAPVRPGEVRRIALDASRAKCELGWGWRVDLAEGVTESVRFYRDLMERVTQ